MRGAFSTARKTLMPGLTLAAVLGLGSGIPFGAATAGPCPPDLPCTDKGPGSCSGKLAPNGLNPAPVNVNHCTTSNCLVRFANYQWWTAYEYPFYNGNLRTPFAPEHVFIGAEGYLHLKVDNDIDLGGGKVWSGGEAVLMFNGDNSEANLGYGDYLVTAKLVGNNWAALDPNVALGEFMYERPSSGPQANPAREIDLAEISRWGWNHTGTCPFSGNNGQFSNNTLCQGSAQFATQIYTQSSSSVQRYDIGSTQVVTLVMRWHNEGQPVTFEKYNGAFTLDTLPPAPVETWTAPQPLSGGDNLKTTTIPALNVFIPSHTSTSCERFHINFWMGNFSNPPHDGPNPPPGSPQEATITNFQFRPSGGLTLPGLPTLPGFPILHELLPALPIPSIL